MKWVCGLTAFIFSSSLIFAEPPAESKSPRFGERLELSMSDGTRYTALLTLPKKTDLPLPVLIVLGGFDTGEKSLEQLPVDLNAIYATVDYPYKAPNQRSFLADLKEIPEIKKAIHRVDLCVDALIEKLRIDPRVNKNRMIFAGASFGAPFAITAAVRNSEIDGILLIHAFGKVESAITQQLVNKWEWWSYPIAFLLGHITWDYLAYKDPETEVRKLHSHQQVLNLYATEDEQLPIQSIQSLQTALSESPAQVTSQKAEGGHLGPGKKEVFSSVIT
ncbi:MAG: hypothetical protein SGJ18_05525 [Pseudomonadota bacterium]|nr:hypothetical protein [Pseudomonadota bacterium]